MHHWQAFSLVKKIYNSSSTEEIHSSIGINKFYMEYVQFHFTDDSFGIILQVLQ